MSRARPKDTGRAEGQTGAQNQRVKRHAVSGTETCCRAAADARQWFPHLLLSGAGGRNTVLGRRRTRQRQGAVSHGDVPHAVTRAPSHRLGLSRLPRPQDTRSPARPAAPVSRGRSPLPNPGPRPALLLVCLRARIAERASSRAILIAPSPPTGNARGRSFEPDLASAINEIGVQSKYGELVDRRTNAVDKTPKFAQAI
jgi:hypothetical protein